jgi:hypothetical protein
MHPLDQKKAELKTGAESLTYKHNTLNYTILDFWRWSVSDILSNATRGRLAEFLIATATNIDITVVRDEWSAYDLVTPDGIKLEIKSAAYLQAWSQKILSKISFSTKLARDWDFETDKRATIAKRHADVYVFCLLKHEDKATVDPLNLNNWEFYIMATSELNNYTRSQHSITLKSLCSLTKAVDYDEINDAIKVKNRINNSDASI